eukprot:g5168.t1
MASLAAAATAGGESMAQDTGVSSGADAGNDTAMEAGGVLASSLPEGYERRISTSEVDRKTGQLVLHELSPDLLKLADPRTVRAEMTVKPVDEMLKLAKNIATEVAQPNLRYGVHSDIATTDHARLHNLKKRNEAEMAFFKSGKIVREESQAAWEEYLKKNPITSRTRFGREHKWTRQRIDNSKKAQRQSLKNLKSWYRPPEEDANSQASTDDFLRQHQLAQRVGTEREFVLASKAVREEARQREEKLDREKFMSETDNFGRIHVFRRPRIENSPQDHARQISKLSKWYRPGTQKQLWIQTQPGSSRRRRDSLRQ